MSLFERAINRLLAERRVAAPEPTPFEAAYVLDQSNRKPCVFDLAAPDDPTRCYWCKGPLPHSVASDSV